jgi:peptide/nickel transport system permease protein
MTAVLAFIARRAVAGAFTIFLMITVTFVIFWATPTLPAQFVYPVSHLSNYQIAHGDHLLGVDAPKFDQWRHYITQVPLFRFGDSWEGGHLSGEQELRQRLPISPIVLPPMRVTLSLLFGGAAVVLLFAVPLGAFAGTRIGSLSDRAVSIVVLVGICTHPMVVGILLRVLFAGQLHWLPPRGYCPLVRSRYGGGCGGVVDWADHLVLPWVTFAMLFLPLYVRMVRSSVADTLNEDFVRTARAKGASELRIVTKHVLPNATSTLVTMIGLEIGTALGVCIFIETAYSLPGLSSTAVRYMSGSDGLDLPLIIAIVFLLTLIVVVGNLLVDSIYVLLDPRVAFRRDKAVTRPASGVL